MSKGKAKRGPTQRQLRVSESLRKALSEERAKRIADELVIAVRAFEKDL